MRIYDALRRVNRILNEGLGKGDLAQLGRAAGERDREGYYWRPNSRKSYLSDREIADRDKAYWEDRALARQKDDERLERLRRQSAEHEGYKKSLEASLEDFAGQAMRGEWAPTDDKTLPSADAEEAMDEFMAALRKIRADGGARFTAIRKRISRHRCEAVLVECPDSGVRDLVKRELAELKGNVPFAKVRADGIRLCALIPYRTAVDVRDAMKAAGSYMRASDLPKELRPKKPTKAQLKAEAVEKFNAEYPCALKAFGRKLTDIAQAPVIVEDAGEDLVFVTKPTKWIYVYFKSPVEDAISLIRSTSNIVYDSITGPEMVGGGCRYRARFMIAPDFRMPK